MKPRAEFLADHSQLPYVLYALLDKLLLDGDANYLHVDQFENSETVFYLFPVYTGTYSNQILVWLFMYSSVIVWWCSTCQYRCNTWWFCFSSKRIYISSPKCFFSTESAFIFFWSDFRSTFWFSRWTALGYARTFKIQFANIFSLITVWFLCNFHTISH